MVKDRRLQVLVEDGQYRAVEAAARERGVSVATVVREALGRYLATGGEQTQDALAHVLGAEPMAVGPPDELARELDALRGRHA